MYTYEFKSRFASAFKRKVIFIHIQF